MEGWFLWRGGRCGGAVVVEGWFLWRCGFCGGAVVVEGRSLWRSGLCGGTVAKGAIGSEEVARAEVVVTRGSGSCRCGV